MPLKRYMFIIADLPEELLNYIFCVGCDLTFMSKRSVVPAAHPSRMKLFASLASQVRRHWRCLVNESSNGHLWTTCVTLGDHPFYIRTYPIEVQLAIFSSHLKASAGSDLDVR